MNVPPGARCAQHPASDALYVCHRCGSFFDEECARRTRPEAVPLCKSCWELRDQKVKPLKEYSATRLQTAGLVMGCCCIIPLPVLLIASLVVNLVAIVKAKEGPARQVRWRPVVGLGMTFVGIAELAIAIAIGASGR